MRASPRGEALFRCARPSGVPRGPATSTGSLASQRHPGKFPKARGSLRTMHGGGSAPSCGAFSHRVAFEEAVGPAVGPAAAGLPAASPAAAGPSAASLCAASPPALTPPAASLAAPTPPAVGPAVDPAAAGTELPGPPVAQFPRCQSQQNPLLLCPSPSLSGQLQLMSLKLWG